MRRPHSRWPVLAAVAAALLPFGGCAWWDGTEQRDIETAMSRTATAISVASSGETSRYAASELAIAREKLADARQAARAEDYITADRLVSQSLVNVQLATAKADAARMASELERLKASAPAPDANAQPPVRLRNDPPGSFMPPPDAGAGAPEGAGNLPGGAGGP